MALALSFLAQMASSKLVGDGTPPLTATDSTGYTWLIAGVLVVGVLLVTFKTTKRNHLERE